MPRKSRRQKQVCVQDKKENKEFKAGIYARVSVTDGALESPSIQNQILIAKQYLDNQKEIVLHEIYIDQGQTGTNFERPSFLRLLQDVEEEKINCIIVKDFSRFGRNYLGMGDYLENYFPKKNVRFISVNDHFDSERKEQQNDFILPLKGIMNDSYAKDISKKVSTAIAVKKSTGRFMGAKPPYGYRRSAQDKYRLEVVEEQAEIIKKIYAWRLKGLGASAIAKRLNDLEVPSWQKLRFLEGASVGRKDGLWRGASVVGILKNPCYMGCLVERKSEKVLYKGGVKKVIPKERWSIIQDTHPPIISREIFDRVQESFEKLYFQRKKILPAHKYFKQEENVFRGQILCGVCGETMQRNNGYFVQNEVKRKYVFYCPRKYLKSKGCETRSIQEQKIKEIFIAICSKQAELFLEKGERERWLQLCQRKENEVFTFLNKECPSRIIVKANYIILRF